MRYLTKRLRLLFGGKAEPTPFIGIARNGLLPIGGGFPQAVFTTWLPPDQVV